ncbi:MAG: selenocysteine-specific translation elongation factor [Actinomycetota bacterium]
MHVIGTAGHVDHGKSSLVTRLTGIDPDRFEEEKRRGLTIDLGFAWLPLPSGREIGIVDVPGHERFIKNMLAGAGGVSICLFVVAANEGWKPQSAEHLSVIDLLGVSAGVVALTKIDTVDAELVELAQAEVEEHLAPSTLAGAPVVPCSAVTGEGIDRLVEELDRLVGSTPPAVDEGRPRLWVDRVFTIGGAGTVVTGTLAGGSLHAGDEVEVRRAHEVRPARIRTIQSHKKEVASIEPGNRVALNLAGLARQGAERGDAIVRPGPWRSTDRLDVELRVLPASLARREHELTERGAHLLYAGSAETPVRIRLLAGERLGPGERGFAQLLLRDPLPLTRGDRFVLRDAGRILTFGGGEVLDPMPTPARRTGDGRIGLLERSRGAPPEQALVALVEHAGPLDAAEAALRVPGAPTELPGVHRLGRRLYAAARVEELRARLLTTLGEHHRAHPLERGMSREAARAALDIDPEAFEALTALTPETTAEEATIRLASHRVDLAPEQQRVRDDLVRAVESNGFQPPLAKELGGDAALIRSLVDSGDLVRVGDFFLSRAQADDARTMVRAYIEEHGPVTVAQIRDLLDTTRKYAVPLCEWLDSTGATRRQGDVRALGPRR